MQKYLEAISKKKISPETLPGLRDFRGLRPGRVERETFLRWLLVLPMVIFFCSCVKDKPESPVQSQLQLSSSRKVYVVNEGNFGSGESSVSLYDPATNQVIEDVFEAQNNAKLGDVTQSLSYINGRYYIVVNNSNKVVVCDKQFKKTGQIGGLTSPRYILPVTNQKAYVSDLYDNAVSIINLNTNAKVSSIPCHGKTEKMALLYNKAFITNVESKYTYVVNTGSDLITDSIFVGNWASEIVIDKYDKIWVLASGEVSKSKGRLSRVDPLTNHVEMFLEFSQGESPNQLCLNSTKDSLYFLNNGVCRMAVTDTQLPGSAFIPKGNRNFYGLGINPHDHTIYVSDALSFNSRSVIYIFDAGGKQKSTFEAGIISNGFYFE